MTTPDPTDPSPRRAPSGITDAPTGDPEVGGKRGDRPDRAARDRELTPEERAARREARKAARKAARAAERREARKLQKREAQWSESIEKVRSGKNGEVKVTEAPAKPSSRPKEPIEVFRATGSGLPPLRVYLHQLRKRRSLIWHLARSALKGENYNTFFGQVWLILNPLMLAGVYILGRSVIRPMGSPGERSFLICHLVGAVFLFQFTSRAMGTGSRSVLTNKAMLLNTPSPVSVYPLSTTVRSIFDLIPLLLTLFVVRIIFDQPTTWVYVFLPFVIGIQLLFNMGLAFGTATLTVFFRDFGNVLAFSTRLWLWTTPVLYTTTEIPDSIRWVLELNPLYPIFAMYEQIWAGEVPDPLYVLWALAWAVPVFVIGVTVFVYKERDFAVRL